MIQFSCPVCSEPVDLPNDWDYTVIACPHCGRTTNLMAASDAAELRTGDRLGHFVLIKLLGSGGNGTVWKAHDQELDRDVAIKFPSRDVIEAKDRVRFLREASLAARVKHPHIVPIHHVGESELHRLQSNGDDETLPSRLYIISELVDGAGLDRFIKAGKRPTPAKAARLVERIADALGAAHQATVIHRDVKPSNIMLDRKGRPFLLDFGVSKSSDSEHRTISVEGAVIGSPGYLSPEQARGENNSLDIRSDIYSLGVVLFELLTFRRPFEGTEKEIEHATADATRDAPSPRQFVSDLPRDLETICLKCLEKDRERRFSNGREVAEELRRFREGLPIISRPISRAERFVRWCQRKPLIAGLSAAVMLTMLIGALISQSLLRRSDELQGEVESKKRELAGTETKLEETETALGSQRIVTQAKAQEAALNLAEAARKKREAYLTRYVADMRLAPEMWATKDTKRLQALLEEHLPSKSKEADARGFEWFYWWRLVTQKAVEPDANPAAPTDHDLLAAAFSPDGRFVAIGHRSRGFQLVDLPEGNIVLETHNGHAVRAVAFSPDGQLIAAAPGDGVSIQVWNLKGRELATFTGLGFPVSKMVFSPDSKLLASTGSGPTSSDRAGEIIVWDIDEATPLISLKDPRTKPMGYTNALMQSDTWGLFFGADGETLWTAGGRTYAGQDGAQQLLVEWDIKTGTLRRLPKTHRSSASALVLSSDGKKLWTGKGVVAEWSLAERDPEKLVKEATRKLAFEIPLNPTGFVRALPVQNNGLLSLSPDNRRLVSTSQSDEIFLIDTEKGESLQTFKGHDAQILAVQIDDQGRVLSIDRLGRIKEWKLGGAATGERTLRFGQEQERERNRRTFHDMRFAGNELVALTREIRGSNHQLSVWNESTNTYSAIGPPPNAMTSQILKLSADGQRVLIYGQDLATKQLATRAWKIGTNEQVPVLPSELDRFGRPITADPQDAPLSGDGKRRLGRLKPPKNAKAICDVATDEEICVLKNVTQLRGVALNHDGSRVYGIPNSANSVVTVWDGNTGEVLRELHSLGLQFTAFNMSADGRRIAIAGVDVKTADSNDAYAGGVRIFDTQTDEEVLSLSTGFGPVQLQFSPDGRQLAASRGYGQIVVWKTAPDPDAD